MKGATECSGQAILERQFGTRETRTSIRLTFIRHTTLPNLRSSLSGPRPYPLNRCRLTGTNELLPAASWPLHEDSKAYATPN